MTSETETEVLVEELRRCPHLLDAVVALGKRFRKKLGLMPRGGFEDHLKAGTILAARRGGDLAGYLLYRAPQRSRTAVVVHLCVHPSFQGAGVARRLVDRLKEETADLDGIRLLCRRDYPENTFWPRVGFQVLTERPGRGEDGTELNVWWLPHRELPLLALANAGEIAARAVVAVDANVFYDLWVDSGDADESRALCADWISEHICLRVTAELNAEIDRNEDAAARRLLRERAAKLGIVTAPGLSFDANLRLVREVLGDPKTPRDESDQRGLAHAAGSEAVYFVTRDEAILSSRDALEEVLTLRVARPADVIAEIDQGADEAPYQPRRFQGSRLTAARVPAGSDDDLAKAFLDSGGGERKHVFTSRLRAALANPGQWRTLLVKDEEQHPIVLAAFDDSAAPNSEIVLLRAAAHKLAPTVLRQVLSTEVAARRVGSLAVSDPAVTDEVRAALRDCGFVGGEGRPCRFFVDGVGGSGESVDSIDIGTGLADRIEIREHLRELANNEETRVMAERLLWPAKFTDLELPTFIVPIRPHWAMSLFDTRLAEADLFGLPPQLAFSLENAYYRAARPGVLKAPGRILWYVSGDVNAIRACSYLDEVVVDNPKPLFRRFRRLGVYGWRDVFDKAGRDLEGQAMAIRFSGTELLPHPVPFQRVQEILQEARGKGNPLMGPVSVSPCLFFRLYGESLHARAGIEST